MTTRRQKQLFEELGLHNEQELVNPYQTLGLSPEFARTLLDEDRSGEALRTIAGGLHRLLSKRYHPDVKNTGNRARFEAIKEANQRIETAPSATLSRWARVDRASQSIKLDHLVGKHETFLEQAADIVQSTMELGNHPQHFSQLSRTQGILVERNRATFLMRQLPEGVLRVTRGVNTDIKPDLSPPSYGEVGPQAFSFQTFLKRHESFGLEPDSKIAAYVNDQGRSTILSPDLTFQMDITEPVMAYRGRRERNLSKWALNNMSSTDFWLRSEAPILFISSIPGPKNGEKPDTKMITFPDQSQNPENPRNMIWDLSMEVVGSLTDPNYFKRMRHNAQVGALAIGASQASQNRSYFNLMAIPTRKLVEDAAGYSPLIAAGNGLLLYDETVMMPVVTDATVIGLIGSNPEAA